MSMTLTITAAQEGTDLDAVKAMCMDFLQWNRARYAHFSWLIERYYDPASWDAYLAGLANLYKPPAGSILLARLGGEPVGCVMMRRLDASTCEMKHLFVREGARGRGVAVQLCTALMTLAKHRGFAVMRLETGSLNAEAMGVYRRLGFHPCDPGGEYPDDVLPLLRFMRADLAARATPAAGC